MENLNAEQVKKWLLVCAEDTPYPDQERALHDALALINKQETEYNELYELCESYRIERDAMRGAANSYKMYSKTLEKENETLKTLLDESYDGQNSVRADTVRKMQERLHARKVSYGNITFRVVPLDDIDQIAKEMLEGA